MEYLWGIYQNELRLNPIKTKALTSSLMGALGEILGQYIRQNKEPMSSQFSPSRIRSSSLYGGVVTGPIMHFWYKALELMVPPGTKHAISKKILLDRLLLTPPFLFLTLYSLNRLNGKTHSESLAAAKRVFRKALIKNWKVWTVTQWISFKYCPLQYRVLWGNAVAVWWNCYLSLNP